MLISLDFCELCCTGIITFYSKFYCFFNGIVRFHWYKLFCKLWLNFEKGLDNTDFTFLFKLCKIAGVAQHLQIEPLYHSKAEKICVLWYKGSNCTNYVEVRPFLAEILPYKRKRSIFGIWFIGEHTFFSPPKPIPVMTRTDSNAVWVLISQ